TPLLGGEHCDSYGRRVNRIEHLGACIVVPEGWRTRALGTVLVLTPVVEPDWSNPWALPISCQIESLHSEDGLARTVRSLLRRRVPQGHPEVILPLKVSGRHAFGVTYSD